MALKNQAVPSLFNGVSQQPAQLRLPSQCEVMDNFYPTLASGLSKRPPAVLLAKLYEVLTPTAFVTVINRDLNERYVLVIDNGSLRVFDAATGEEKTVTFPNGTSYLTSTTPRQEFATVSIADHTFVVNKGVTVRAKADKSPENENIGYVHFTYNGTSAQRTLHVVVSDDSGTLASAAATAYYDDGTYTKLGTMISEIESELESQLSGWTVTKPWQNMIRIVCPDDRKWTLTVSDDYGSTCMKAIQGHIQLFSDLPAQLDDGYVCYISSRPEDQGKGYYVRYDRASKSYIECPAQGIEIKLNPNTMPHKLVRNADGTFTFTVFDWDDRTVGDDTSNPFPTFVDRTIQDIFLWRNRLGLLADENVCLSRAGDYFNFSIKTATAVTDADPIDIAVANTKVSILRYAVPFDKSLILFSDQTQFQLSGGDVLSPKTVKADPVTEFSSSAYCRPVPLGPELFFITDRPGATGVREYYVQQDALTNDAVDVTAHVPSYVPPDAFKMAACTAEDMVMLLTETQRNVIYCYKFYWNKDEKAQSAWFRFVFNTDDTILGCDFIGSVAYLAIQRSDGVYLETMNMQPGEVDAGLTFNSLLDRKVSLQGTYDDTTNLTTWTLPYPYAGPMFAILGEAFGTKRGSSFPLSRTGDYTVTALGDWSTGPCYIGTAYTALYRFSEQYLKDAQNVAIVEAKIKLRRMFLNYVSSGYFRVEVTPPGRDTNTYPFTGKSLGVKGVKLGAPSMSSGVFRFPVLSGSKDVLIDIINDGPLPSTFQGAEWEGEIVVGASR